MQKKICFQISHSLKLNVATQLHTPRFECEDGGSGCLLPAVPRSEEDRMFYQCDRLVQLTV